MGEQDPEDTIDGPKPGAMSSVEEGQIDLMLSMTGASYQELASDARTFDIDGRSVLVGRLERLLRSKELTGRPKDKEFLRAFAAQMEKTDEGE